MSAAMDWSERAACKSADPDLFFPLADEDDSQDWRDRARCAETDPELWFPERGHTGLPAKRICAQCEVRQDCLDYALETNQNFGVWGGLSEHERRDLRRPQASEAA